jgi:hypothetical protein
MSLMGLVTVLTVAFQQIQGTGTNIQFLLLSTPPKKELQFQATKKAKGAFLAYHGSGFFNWHSIIRNGLRNLST